MFPLRPDLEATFCKWIPPDAEHPSGGARFVDTLAEADGIWFLCPKCFSANHGPIGTHMICCWFVGKVPDGVEPGPGRWNPSGTGYDDLTFVPPGRFSVELTGGGCAWHGYIAQGKATLTC